MTRRRGLSSVWERLLLAGLLVTHAVMVGRVIASNSVTFDESFHVPAGVVQVARGATNVSTVNPPFVKSLYGAAALLVGVKVPEDSVIASGDQARVGERFMRLNAEHFHRPFAAARVVTLCFSLALAVLIWRLAREAGGPWAGLTAAALWITCPEAIAHAGVATLDVPTALAWLGLSASGWRLLTRSTRRDAAIFLVWLALLSVTRFTVFIAPVLLLAMVLAAFALRRFGSWRPVVFSAVLAPVVVLLAWQVVYLGHTSLRPLTQFEFRSARFESLAARLPGWRLPVPDDLLRGLDRQSFDSEPGHLTTFLFDRRTSGPVHEYFLVAPLYKWPIGLLAGMVVAFVLGLARRRGARAVEWCLVSAMVFLAPAVFIGTLGAGVRYLLPLVPLACIGVGQLAAGGLRWERAGRVAALAVVLAQTLEMAPSLPYPLAFFNRFGGGPGGGEHILNDSNIDWGQGLIALREELQRRGIGRVYLAYHGTVDPAVYGIDSTPFTGGEFGAESDYLVVSSYFLVGLPARMMTAEGYTPNVWVLDMKSFWGLPTVAEPAGCLRIYRLR